MVGSAMLSLLDEARAKAGLPQQTSDDADAKAVMAKACEEHLEEQELTSMASCDTPAPAAPAVDAPSSSLPSMPSVPHGYVAAMNVERDHVFEADDEDSERKPRAPKLATDQIMQMPHEDDDEPFTMEEVIIEAMEEYGMSFENDRAD